MRNPVAAAKGVVLNTGTAPRVQMRANFSVDNKKEVCTIQPIKTMLQIARFRAPAHIQAWQLMPKVALSPVTVSVTDSNEVRCPRAAPATHPVGTDP